MDLDEYGDNKINQFLHNLPTHKLISMNYCISYFEHCRALLKCTMLAFFGSVR